MSISGQHLSPKRRQFGRGHAIVMTLAAAPIVSRALDLSRAGPIRPRAGALGRTLGQLIIGVIRNRVRAWMARRAIESLQSLDDRTLADIGMHRSEIEYLVHRRMMSDGEESTP